MVILNRLLHSVREQDTLKEYRLLLSAGPISFTVLLDPMSQVYTLKASGPAKFTVKARQPDYRSGTKRSHPALHVFGDRLLR